MGNKLTQAEKAALAAKIEANREEIIDAIEEQYKKSWGGAQQTRYYTYIDHETGEPRSYEHYGSELLPENVWNGTDPLIAEYTADGISPEEAAGDGQYLQSVIEYMDDEQCEQFEAWQASEEYHGATDGMTDTECEEHQTEWIKEHTDAYERYCEDIIDNRWEEELPNVEQELDKLIKGLQE